MSISEEQVRNEVRAWLEENWSPNLDLVEWRLKLADSGWGMANWPAEWYGRDLPVSLVPAIDEEFNRIGALTIPKSGIRMLAAATILNHGSDMHKEKFLKRIITGEDVWCQLFSEPGSGSDLAGATTKAVMVGNKWVVNGQKVWCSGGRYSNWGILMARTDPNLPKHRGISFFLIDMHSDGIETRPLRQMTGEAEFDEVFFTDVSLPQTALLGPLNGGWHVGMDILTKERGSIGAGAITMQRRLDSLQSLANKELSHDKRQQLAQLLIKGKSYHYLGQRQGPAASVSSSLNKFVKK